MKSLSLVPYDDPSVSEILQLMCAITDVNSLELRPPGSTREALYLRGLFEKTSLLSHSCRGNLHLTMNRDFKLTVHASVPIKKGDIICFNYTSPLLVCLFVYYKIFILQNPMCGELETHLKYYTIVFVLLYVMCEDDSNYQK